MNEPTIHDPELLAMESRLAGTTPHLALLEQQSLLYHCAFQAGLNRGAKSSRRWQWVAVASLALATSTGLTLIRSDRGTGSPVAVSRVPKAVPPHEELRPNETLAAGPQLAEVRLDAWALPETELPQTDDLRVEPEPVDANVRLLTLAALSRGALNTPPD